MDSSSLNTQNINEIVTTADGSHTILSNKFGVTYHSKYGAITESDHVFIKAGLDFLYPRKNKIRVFEMGFGTGLNPILLMLYAKYHSGHFSYLGIEKYPLPNSTVSKLNYNECLQLSDDELQIFIAMHASNDFTHSFLQSEFSFEKRMIDLEEFSLPKQSIDLIFFDAFAPNSQSELWTPKILEKCFNMCAADSVLVTYCAKGQLRRDLQSVGFSVERIPGPPGKREMLRASKA